jgi:hypothetical protein
MAELTKLRALNRRERKICYFLLRRTLPFHCPKTGSFSLEELLNSGKKTVGGLYSEAMR